MLLLILMRMPLSRGLTTPSSVERTHSAVTATAIEDKDKNQKDEADASADEAVDDAAARCC